MERPFFSLAKRKRLKPIEYMSPKADIFVNVYPNQEFGMATIWDADVLIWAASIINNLRKSRANDIPRTLHFHPYDLLKTIGRKTGGRQYGLLREGLGRLQATTIVTNIRVKRGKKHRQFSWIESWTDRTEDDEAHSRGMSLTLSDWFYEGILMEGGLLSIDPVYFTISGGRERWLYRVARKHAGGAGEVGFAISLPTLFEKAGAEGTYRRFKFEIQAICQRNGLPGIDLALEEGNGEPVLRMICTTKSDTASTTKPARRERVKRSPKHAPDPMPLFQPQLSDDTIARIRRNFPGWDIYALKAEFDAWIACAPDRRPEDYDAAFYGFVRRYDAREGRPLTRS